MKWKFLDFLENSVPEDRAPEVSHHLDVGAEAGHPGPPPDPALRGSWRVWVWVRQDKAGPLGGDRWDPQGSARDRGVGVGWGPGAGRAGWQLFDGSFAPGCVSALPGLAGAPC